MADQASTPSSIEPARGGRGGNRGRGRGNGVARRGRGGADSAANTIDTNQPTDGEPRRGGRGGNRARGERGGRGGQSRGRGDSNIQTGASSIIPTTAASPTDVAAPTTTKDSPEEDEDEEICFICANPIQYHSIAPCNHMTCHICSLRMRALYKTQQCPHCRTSSDWVIFTTKAEKTFEEYTEADIAATEKTLGIKYEGKQIQEDTLVLLRYNCPEPNCDMACLGWPDLHRHVRAVHHLHLCDLCTRFKKVFTHEHTLFTQQALRKHERTGDDVPGAEDQSGFKGHPECAFCRKRFYGDDELYAHCKEAHERCFLCDRDTTRRPQYFENFDTLNEHFKTDHFRCEEPECLLDKFVVFGSQMDLKAHNLEKHPNQLSKEELKSMRKVDLSSFSDPHAAGSSSRGGRGGFETRRAGGGRGGRMERDYRRDPQAPEPPPPPQNMPLRRDEIAYQRTLQVQSAQNSIPQRTFGGQLSRPQPAPQPVSTPTPAPQPGTRPAVRQDAFPPLGGLSLSSPPPTVPSASASVTSASAPRPPPANVSAATSQKHEAVITRATKLLNGDSSKLETFKKYISNYNSEKMSAKDLIEAFWVLFDVRAADLATLVRELSELFEKEEKRRALLESWNEWKAINEDYPPMPGSSIAAATGGTTSAARVLKLKNATNRNLHAGASPWSSVTSNTINTGAGSLANINGGARTTAGKGKAAVTPWAAAAKNQQGPSTVASRIAGRSTASRPVNTMEFPSLPPAAPKHPPVARKNEGVPPASVWSSSGSGAGGADSYGPGDGNDLEGVGVKGKGKKKQIVIQWG